jgi:hypothetical protein
LKASVDVNRLRSELAGVIEVFDKPFAMKGMMFNYNIDFLAHLFPEAIFIYVKRDPLTNIASALEARERQYGDLNRWYSFKIPEYTWLKERDPHEQVAGQIYHINRAVASGLESVSEDRKISVSYEAFCDNPSELYEALQERLKMFDLGPYTGPDSFEVSPRSEVLPDIQRAYELFYSSRSD